MEATLVKWETQFLRYAIVGLASNAFSYSLYLLLTYAGLGHKIAMSLLYLAGVFQTFYFNRGWTFRHDGRVSITFLRYIIAYGFGYCLNLSALLLFVDRWHWPHQLVQGAMILMLAVMLFLLQRFWVFR